LIAWVRRKTPFDFHLIFPDWHEQDLRAFIRRDRNHPSVILWSVGNEVGEQYTGDDGAKVAQRLMISLARDEDPDAAGDDGFDEFRQAGHRICRRRGCHQPELSR
jgi:hypothetical protein